MVCNVIGCFGCEYKQIIAKIQLFFRKKKKDKTSAYCKLSLTKHCLVQQNFVLNCLN
jgi:hypothetical protein